MDISVCIFCPFAPSPNSFSLYGLWTGCLNAVVHFACWLHRRQWFILSNLARAYWHYSIYFSASKAFFRSPSAVIFRLCNRVWPIIKFMSNLLKKLVINFPRFKMCRTATLGEECPTISYNIRFFKIVLRGAVLNGNTIQTKSRLGQSVRYSNKVNIASAI